jgi:probable phosphoglycerate mutase
VTTAGRPRSVVLVRHGATEWSEAGKHTGRIDLPLIDAGVRQVETLAGALAEWRFDRVLCSPLQRARMTVAAAGFGDVVEIDPDLQEWDYGEYEGLTIDEIREQRPAWNIWDGGVTGGESITDVATRAHRVLDRIREVGGDVALFAHGHLLRILAACWLGGPPLLARHLSLSTASISVLGWEHDWASIRGWNDTHHLSSLD